MRWADAVRARLRLLLSRRGAESRMNREFAFHIEMESERLSRAHGLPPGEARRRALAAFGGVEHHKEAMRDGRGLAWLSGLSLDIRLAVRTLRKYPAVTLVGGLAMTVGIGLGAGYLEVVNDFVRPALPLDEGDRIVGLQNWDVAENKPDLRSAADFTTWRIALHRVQNLGAFRAIERNVGMNAETADPALGAEITSSAFDTVRVAALFGRTLSGMDERAGAPSTIVLGHDLWMKRFGGDATILGRTIGVGDSSSTVVGIMPPGFAFPVNQQFWVPLRLGGAGYEARQGPAIHVFGRLAPGVSLEEAQAELTASGTRMAADSPAHEHLRPRVVRYTELFVGGPDARAAYYVQVLFVLLLLVLSSNVATMVFARTATRAHEIAMRFALGATRGRIVVQFFVEVLVLALAASVAGLAIVAVGTDSVTRLAWDVTQGRIPFWLDTGATLNTTTVLYAIAVALLASLVAGALPAFKATRSRLQASLRHPAGMADSTLRFGGLWSVLIVVQVAFAVMVLPPAIVAMASLGQQDHVDPGFAAQQYLSARLEMDADGASNDAAGRDEASAAFQAACDELRRRLAMQPQVTRVTMASRLPGMNHPEPDVEVEPVKGGPSADASAVMATSVAPDYFDAFGARIIAGRGLTSGDVRTNAAVVVVNEDFAARLLQGRNAVGRRIRYSTRYGEWYATGQPQGLPRAVMLQPGRWYEIVGVVKNLGMDTTRDAFAEGYGPGIYHALTSAGMRSGDIHSVRVAFHVDGDATGFGPDLRELARAVSPSLRIHDVLPLNEPIDKVSQGQRRVARFVSWLTALVAVIALLICVAGIYAVMSFTVARQTREIGIRIALGADRRRIVSGVFSRAMAQIATGLVIGATIWFYVIGVILGGADRVGLLAATAAGVMLVGVIACGVPVRRALRIEPTEALRHDG